MADHFAAGRKEHVSAEHRRAGIGTAIELAQHGAVGDVTIGADHGIAIHHHPAEAVDEEARTDLGIFGNRDAIFVAIAQQQQLERRIEGPLGPAPLLEVAAEAHHNGIFETRREEKVLHERMEPHTPRSEEHTSELQSLMRISYAV